MTKCLKHHKSILKEVHMSELIRCVRIRPKLKSLFPKKKRIFTRDKRPLLLYSVLCCLKKNYFTDLSIPCLVLTAADGTDGKTLWKRPLEAEFDWVECGVKGLGRQGTGCLVAHADNLTAVDKKTGTGFRETQM